MHFRPEFLNRLDDMIVFDRLTRADMTGIVTIQLKRLEKRLAQRKIALELDEGARKWLADEGYDPVYGARPLKRVIQRQLQDPLAEMILAGEVRDGDTVHVTAGAGRADRGRPRPVLEPAAAAGRGPALSLRKAQLRRGLRFPDGRVTKLLRNVLLWSFLPSGSV